MRAETERLYQSVDEAGDPILEMSLHLWTCRASGPGLREIAAAAAVSPALIAYRFGSLKVLRSAVFEESRRREDHFWKMCRETYLAAPIRPVDLAGLLTELLLRENQPDDRIAALRWRRTLAVVRSGGGAAASRAGAETEFWNALAGRLGCTHRQTQIVQAFYHAMAFGHLVCAGAPGFQAWSATLIHRFTLRFFKCPVPWPEADSAWREAAGSLEPDPVLMVARHPTHEALLEGAVGLLVEEGTSALTHRRLANAAHTSLSSVSHFLTGRDELIRHAYAHLYKRLTERALQRIADAGALRLTAQQLAAALTPPDRSAEHANHRELFGLLNAIFEASRSPDTRPLAMSLFSRFGDTSRKLLGQLNAPALQIGWLDAQLFRLITTGLALVAQDDIARDAPRAPAALEQLFAETFTLFAD